MNKYWILLLVPLLAVGCASGPNSSPQAGERYAVIETSASRKADGIFPVLITQIDDQTINVTQFDMRKAWAGFPYGRTHFRVRPGEHRIEALAFVNRNYVPGLTRDVSRSNNDPLIENFQAGKRYFIGLKADSGRRADWTLVVWKTEDIEEGTLRLGGND